MKLFVWFLFSAMPWLPWVGDWALRWTRGSEALEVTFSMFIFPLGMNAVQYWVIDNFIMDRKKSGEGYQQVLEEDEDEGVRDRDEGELEVVEEEDVRVKDDQTLLKETRAVSARDSGDSWVSGEGSRSPPKYEQGDGRRQ